MQHSTAKTSSSSRCEHARATCLDVRVRLVRAVEIAVRERILKRRSTQLCTATDRSNPMRKDELITLITLAKSIITILMQECCLMLQW
eukprot:752888-Amphidinium_carterae.1